MRKPLGALTRNVAIYGAGDVAVTAVSLMLLPFYMRVLTPADFGALYLLLFVETVTKLLFRLGLDGAFMRYYLDRAEGRERQVLASTLWIFLALASGALLAGLLLLSPLLAHHLFKTEWARYLTPLRLVLVNMYLLTFTFIPFHAMRMNKQALTFSAFTLGRSVSTLVLRIVLVLWAGMGLTGMWVADLAVTIVVVPLLWPWMRDLWRPEFSTAELRQSLRFGLPRLPHGLAQQALDAGNQYLLSRFIPLDRQGVYGIGTTIGRGTKLFLSAFETGWAPFYYETARHPDAKTTFCKITTYGIAILAILVAGSVAVGPDLIRFLTPDAYQDAGLVVPLIALGIALQGVYLLTSIGLNITSQTQYYPASTFAAAAVGLGSGLWLMPRYGIEGAALAFVLSYFTLALVAGFFSNRQYPMAYERGRIARVVIAGVIAGAAGWALPDMPVWLGVI
ncbi:MAG: polysaccharide biosynthesis C-terminal domain-containing protein, partial [Vicinamibacterales bacterium]